MRIQPADAALLAFALTLATLPWPLLVRPAHAKGGGPTPTPVPTEQIHHYHLDHLGSPQLVTDGAGGVVRHLRYLPYGGVRDTGDPPTKQDDRLFTGYEAEPLSDHYYAGERYYDPEFALFLTHDPARQFASPYTYTNWNPIGRTDPTGAQAEGLYLVGGSAAAASATSAAAATQVSIVAEGTAGLIGSAGSAASPSIGKIVLEESGGPIRVGISFFAAGEVLRPAPLPLQAIDGLKAAAAMYPTAALPYAFAASNGLSQAIGQGANVHAPLTQNTVNVSNQTSQSSVAAGQGVAKYVGVQSAIAGDVRAAQDAAVRALDPFDSVGRTAIKDAARADTPLIYRGLIERIRPNTGPRPGSVGRANVPNPAASLVGSVLRVGGRVTVGTSLMIDAGRVYISTDRIRTVVQVGFGTVGAFGGGALGGIGGSALAPGPGTFLGAVGGAAIGSAGGEALGGTAFDFFFR